MNPVPGQSLERLRPIVQAFGAAASMPFFQLDDQGAAAVRLASGARLELEYAPASDRPFAYVEILVEVPQAPEQWKLVARLNVGLMSSDGFSVGLGQIDGSDRLVALASLAGPALSEEDLGRTLLRLVEAALQAGNQVQESAGAPAPSGNAPPPWTKALRI